MVQQKLPYQSRYSTFEESKQLLGLDQIGGTWLDPRVLCGMFAISGDYKLMKDWPDYDQSFFIMLSAPEHYWTYQENNPLLLLARFQEIGIEISAKKVAMPKIEVYKQRNVNYGYFIRVEIKTGW